MRALKISILVLLSSASLAVTLSASRAQRTEREEIFDRTIRPFLSKHCYTCHSTEAKLGGLDLESYRTAASALQHRQVWERIAQRLQAGEMPPPGMPRPEQAELAAILRWIEQEVEHTGQTADLKPETVTARRLNRAEYNNTVRDLVGLDLEPANDFPQDDSAHGFDNIAVALSLSPTLMEKYLAAAERIARLAIFGPELKPSTARFEPPQPRRMEINPVRIEQPPFYTFTDYDSTGIGHPGAFHLTHRFPADGEYLFRIRANGARPPGSEPQSLQLWIDGKVVETFEVQRRLTATNESLPVFMEIRLEVKAGPHRLIAAFPRLFEGLPPSFGGLHPSTRPIPPPPDPEQLFTPLPPDATSEQIEARKAAIERFRNRKPQFNGLAVIEFEIVGPDRYVRGPSLESLRKIYVCGHFNGEHQPGCDRKIVSSLARRAFRRAVTAEEIGRLLEISNRARARGRSFEQGIALVLQTILVSPDFLFRIEPDRNAKSRAGVHPINEYELASRLSYFLWSSMPDEQLLRAADRKLLRRPEVLAAQVRRMLKSPRSEALVKNFAGQWLEIRRLESVQPDRDRFPDFDNYLRQSMLKETELFFENIVRHDGTMLDFIDSDYTFLNERLARHYGIPGISGPEFRKVALTGTRRGGILTQSSVLTVSSYANRTSPVLRGKWILENLLNAPPPPPPPDVPVLDEAAIGSKISLRQQMEQHRSNVVCASCHARMDPLGFSLENYDAVGAWRTQDGKFPIDPSGSLPDGRPLKGPEDLKAYLKSERKVFAEALTEKLLTYALGRGIEQNDRAAVKKIAARAAADQYRFSSLILGIAESPSFQYRDRNRGE